MSTKRTNRAKTENEFRQFCPLYLFDVVKNESTIFGWELIFVHGQRSDVIAN